MIAGYQGGLLPEDFLDRWLSEPGRVARATEVHRAVRRWRVDTASLGPASGLHALADTAALPLASLLDLERVGPVSFRDDFAVVPYQAERASVVLIVTRWGASLHRFWRDSVVSARRSGAEWCLLFNGTHLRLILPSRLHSRRYAELELDAVADDGRSAAALWSLFSAQALGSDADTDSLRRLLALAEHHASTVCRSLRSGVLDASAHVLRTLLVHGRGQATDQVFEPQGTSCGSNLDTGCNAPDSCDDSGACIDRKDPITASCVGSSNGDSCVDACLALLKPSSSMSRCSSQSS